MASKAALSKAYDAGQAAQARNLPDEVCPFEEDSEEYDAYMDGKSDDLSEKWNQPLGAISVSLGN